MSEALLDIRDLSVEFRQGGSVTQAVRGVSLSVAIPCAAISTRLEIPCLRAKDSVMINAAAAPHVGGQHMNR